MQVVVRWEGEDGDSENRGKEKLCSIISYQMRKATAPFAFYRIKLFIFESLAQSINALLFSILLISQLPSICNPPCPSTPSKAPHLNKIITTKNYHFLPSMMSGGTYLRLRGLYYYWKSKIHEIILIIVKKYLKNTRIHGNIAHNF